MEYRGKTGSRMEVIFNVFKDLDKEIYGELLRTDRKTVMFSEKRQMQW